MLNKTSSRATEQLTTPLLAPEGKPMLSRVADSLYWMARYLERAEHTARVLDVNLHQMLDQTPEVANRRWELMLSALHITSLPPQATRDVYRITHALAFDRSSKSSIVSYISAARENARQVREQISSEMWEHINRLYLYVRRTSKDDIWQVEPHEFFQSVKEGSHLFQGITDSTMSHGEGWHFIQVGRFIERAITVASMLDTYFGVFQEAPYGSPVLPFDYLVWVGLLKSCTAFEAYCKVCTATIEPRCIVDFLLLNAEFPHSVRFSANMVQSGLQAIAAATFARNAGPAERLAGRLRAMLDYMHIDEVMAGSIHTYLEHIASQCAQIHTAIQDIYIAYPIEVALGQ
jgi:uncharacterized alpha-E superfamily protein